MVSSFSLSKNHIPFLHYDNLASIVIFIMIISWYSCGFVRCARVSVRPVLVASVNFYTFGRCCSMSTMRQSAAYRSSLTQNPKEYLTRDAERKKQCEVRTIMMLRRCSRVPVSLNCELWESGFIVILCARLLIRSSRIITIIKRVCAVSCTHPVRQLMIRTISATAHNT